jgi:hypothetical protein
VKRVSVRPELLREEGKPHIPEAVSSAVVTDRLQLGELLAMKKADRERMRLARARAAQLRAQAAELVDKARNTAHVSVLRNAIERALRARRGK